MGTNVPGAQPGRADAAAHVNAPSAPGSDVVVVSDVSKAFGEAHALRLCSLSARAGEIHAVVGENGSGKSTLAKLLAGVLSPDSGSVHVNGGRPGSPSAARALGAAVVFQEILVAEGCTVLDNLFLGHDGLFRAKMSQRQKRTKAQALLSRLVGSVVDLDGNVNDQPLSVRQWLVIARALLGDPRVVIFDESTAALDHASVERFFDMVRQLRETGVCVLIVTHRIHELTAICDRATVLSDGADVGTLAGDEITERRLLEMMSGEARTETAHRTMRKPVRHGLPAHAHETLEIASLKLTTRAAPIDLVVRSGEIVGLAGLEGHGQAEFIRAVTGIDRAAAGDVYVNDHGRQRTIDSARAADRANVAYIPGDRKSEGVFPNLSVFENFGIASYRRTARAGFIDRRKVGRLFLEQVKSLSIRSAHRNAPINSLSGGNQQKVIIGRSLAASPLVLALNDPTRGVDIATKQDVYDLLRSLADDGKAILFLSNEIEEFVGLCDRVVVFRSQTAFATLSDDNITSDTVLAAMFGSVDSETSAAGGIAHE